MNLRWSNNRFEAEGVGPEDGKALHLAGFELSIGFNVIDLLWYSEKAEPLSNLRKNRPSSGLTITPEARAQYLSRATTSDLDIPCPSMLSYLPYQKAAIEYALKVFGDL